jgi:pteridine reductase
VSGLMDLSGKTALITGGAKRLGAAVVRRLAEKGVHCVIHHHTASQDAQRLADEIGRLGVGAYLVRGDLSEHDVAERIWSSAEALSGPIDILINSASIFPEGTLEDLSSETLFENAQINTLSPFQLAQNLAKSGRTGSVINFLDTMVRDYDKKHVPYHLSKKMLHDLTRMMALDYGPMVRVNAVAPGLVLPPVGKDERYLETLKHSNPLNTFGSAEQIAHAVVFLLTNEFITGQTIYVDGGRNLRGSMYE